MIRPSVKDDLLLENPIRFDPPAGYTEWPESADWTDVHWAHWLREHNKYPFLRQWSDEAIKQYLEVDRYYYGVGFKRNVHEAYMWFYNPTPIAVPFHKSTKPNILFGGAAGGSKSHSARWDAIRRCFAFPKFRAIIMRRTFEELKKNHLDNVESECQQMNAFFGEKKIIYTSTEHEVTVNVHGPGQEAKIFFGHCQNVGDEKKYLGDAYHAVYPDEAATFEQKQIIGVAGRLRSSIRGVKPRLGMTSNPGGSHTLWLRDYYITKQTEKIQQDNPRYKPENYEFIQAMLWDNPYYMDPDGTYSTYEDRLFEYDPERRRQLLLGDWDALAGQFFPEFDSDRHVKILNIPEGSRIERWVDWGYDPHYGVCLWVAIFPNGRIYVFAEWKFNGESAREKLIASEVAKRIQQYTVEEIYRLVPKTRRVSKSIGDPSMWGKDGHTGEDYAETFRRSGVHLIKADNDRNMGWGRLRHWLRLAPDGMPWIMFHPRCTTTIRVFPSVVRDRNDPDDIDTTGEDHPVDACRYGVMARPSPWKLRPQLPQIISGSMGELMQTLRGQGGRLSGMVS